MANPEPLGVRPKAGWEGGQETTEVRVTAPGEGWGVGAHQGNPW
jgi:hypothetical protein